MVLQGHHEERRVYRVATKESGRLGEQSQVQERERQLQRVGDERRRLELRKRQSERRCTMRVDSGASLFDSEGELYKRNARR